MGNSSSKDKPASRQTGARNAGEPAAPGLQRDLSNTITPSDRFVSHIHSHRSNGGRSSRPDLSFLHLGRDRVDDQPVPERPRETKQERDARRAERERQLRMKERQRSMRDEHVDGGYLVTLGVYTGAEDFSKAIVRQLQIERKLAPFWRGLNSHSDSWTEYQLVAAANGLPIPAPDAIPPDLAGNQVPGPETSGSSSIPVNGRPPSRSDSNYLSTSHPHTASSPTTSRKDSTGQLFRGRAKTLASLATGSKSQSPDMAPQEIRLPEDPHINGQRIEAFLYKDAAECPICFMYYPPYLNQTRCCNQPICSECFVQIKRPDPHPPEHEQPGEQSQRPPEEEAETLVSEVAACPFCVTPEFGVTYEPPPFRRGLAYAHQQNPSGRTPAMSSSTSLTLGAGNGRKRGMSLSANDPQVVTTDRVRPDWAKKLADARAHALRRSAAATALHNAAYVLGGQESSNLGGLTFARRRRTLFRDSPSVSGSGTPIVIDSSTALRSLADLREQQANNEAAGGSRRNRVDDLEDLMLMEAIRMSLASEEERKRKEEKEAKKQAKKRLKEEKKEAKQAEKMTRKSSAGPSIYRAGTNDSTSSWTSNILRSTSNLGRKISGPEDQVQGKGKGPAHEPTSALNTEFGDPAVDNNSPSNATLPSIGNPQSYLEQQRLSVQAASGSKTITSGSGLHQRHLSNASSVASSYLDSGPGSLHADSNIASANPSVPDLSRGSPDASAVQSGDATPAGGAGLEPMLNFHSLTAIIKSDEKGGSESQHVEHTGSLSDPAHEATLATSSGSAAADTADEPRTSKDTNESSGSSTSPAANPTFTEVAEKSSDDELDSPAFTTADADHPQPYQSNVHMTHEPPNQATQ